MTQNTYPQRDHAFDAFIDEMIDASQNGFTTEDYRKAEFEFYNEEDEDQAVDRFISDNFSDPDYRDFMAKVIDTSATGFDLSDPNEYQAMPMDEFISYMASYPHN